MVAAPSVSWEASILTSAKEKESDQIGKACTSQFGKQLATPDDAGLFDNVVARRPLLGLHAASQDMTGLLSGSGATGLTRSVKPTPLRQTPSPDLVAPIGASTPVIEPYLKELSASPASSQLSPRVTSKPRGGGPPRSPRGVRECASASPPASSDAVGAVQPTFMSAPPSVPLRSRPGTRALVKVRVRRALTLQTSSEGPICPKVQPPSRRTMCSKSVESLNLSGASLQSAARANLSRSFDWPSCSAACIRKRVEEGTGYEVPRKKSSRLEGQSLSWDSAADCLAQMSLQAKGFRSSFGDASVRTGVQQV